MTHRLWLIAVVAALSAPAAAGQTREARGPVRGTGVISGVVVSDDAEARPVRKARITCSGADVAGNTTITDDGGRFVFAGLAAGRYTVTASKASWVTMSYGARRPLRPGSAIPLKDAQKVDIVVRLPRGAVITGVVLDFNNQPAAGTTVRAMRYVIVNGERRLDPAGQSTTDDRGTYRIYGLAPGDYVVGATGREGSRGGAELHLTSDADVRYATAPRSRIPPPPERTVTLAPTYYPGSTISTQASVVPVRAGEERGGVDFTLQLAPTARVAGTVLLPDGNAPPGTEVNLIALGQTAVPGQPFESLRTTGLASDGSFTFGDVSPGQYTVLARAARALTTAAGTNTEPLQILWASTQIAVDGEHITGLSLSLEPGLTISGLVRFEGSAMKPPADLRSIRVSAAPASSPGSVSFAPRAVTVSPDGRFMITGVTPGRYRISASFPGSGRPGGWLLKSVMAGGQDSLDAPLALQPNEHVLDAAITFTDQLAQITGTLRNAAGIGAADYTVVLFPVEQSRWIAQSRRIQGVRPGADGAFTFRNLPAGEYIMTAVDDVEPGEWFDPAFLQRIAPSGTKVMVGDGEQKVQDLRIGAAREPEGGDQPK
jgi:uncharacterized protein (DUF2141 family)